MRLEVAVRHALGDFRLDAAFAAEGGLTALFGRSGSGKTSLVNVIAGLIRPDHGRVALDGAVMVDTERHVFVPRHRRRVGYVFQDHRLFPHLSVRQNLLYGRWFSPREQRRGSLDHVVETLGLGHLMQRRPRDLSGGEKSRVAIGRAWLASPRLLLMDEPLASLDEARRHEVLPYIERLRDEARVPIVYVSHSVEEVARLATTIVVMADGLVAAYGPAPAIMGRLDLFPLGRSPEAGALVDAIVSRHDERFGLTMLDSKAGELLVPRLDLIPGSPVRARIQARDVTLALTRPHGVSALNILAGTVAEIGAGAGPAVDVRLDCHGQAILARVTRRSVVELGLAPGLPVHAMIKAITFDRRGLFSQSDDAS